MSKRLRNIDMDCDELLDNSTGLPKMFKTPDKNIKLNELKRSIRNKHVSYEMIVGSDLSIDKKIELLIRKAEMNDLADENGTRSKYLIKHIELYNAFIQATPKLKPTYQTLDYDIHNPTDEFIKRLELINLDCQKKTYIYGKIMELSSCTHDEESHNLKVWLEYITTYPWNITKSLSLTDLDIELNELRQKVDREIYGMTKAKEEMLKYYMNFKSGKKSYYTIALCGPPGVGKTIFFQVFAKHINIPFRLIQGGCITDVGSIQGGLKMYIGASAGCITDAIHSAKREDVMIVFDELEKIYDNVNPLAIMNQINHVVDRSSNRIFVDNYINSNLPVNYSKCLFGATMNDKLRLTDVTDNRLLIIDLKGYILEEKINIVKNYVLPNMMEKSNDQINIIFGNDIIKYIIEKKTINEPGIRKLEHIFQQIINTLQYLHVINKQSMKIPIILTKKMVDDLLK